MERDLLPNVPQLTSRIRHIARDNGISVAQLAMIEDAGLMRFNNFGKKSLALLRQCYPELAPTPERMSALAKRISAHLVELAQQPPRLCPHCGHEYRITDLDRD